MNVSKSGISFNIGKKGANFSIGQNGVYSNFGIPGSGLYYRNRIMGNRISSNNTTTSPSKGSYGCITKLLISYLIFVLVLVFLRVCN